MRILAETFGIVSRAIQITALIILVGILLTLNHKGLSLTTVLFGTIPVLLLTFVLGATIVVKGKSGAAGVLMLVAALPMTANLYLAMFYMGAGILSIASPAYKRESE